MSRVVAEAGRRDAEAASTVVAEAAPSARSGGGSGRRQARGRAASDKRCGFDVGIGDRSFHVA
jgi:hypothetical protein